MRTFISTLNKLSISTAEGIKEFYPLYLVPGELAETVAALGGIEEAGELFDVEAIKNISAEVKADREAVSLTKAAIRAMRDDISAQIDSLAAFYESVSAALQNASAEREKASGLLKEAQSLAEEVRTIKIDGEAEAAVFLEKTAAEMQELQKSADHTASALNASVRDMAERLEAAERLASSGIKETAETVKAGLAKYAADCSSCAEAAKRWASNPEGVAVEGGLYSAYHYARLAEFVHGGSGTAADFAALGKQTDREVKGR